MGAMQRGAFAVGVVMAGVSCASIAGAQALPLAGSAEITAADRQRAAVLFDRSAIAYREGRYEDAIVMLREAHDVSAEPILLYNLGRAYEGLRDEESALAAYRRFLETIDPADAEARAESAEPSARTVRAAVVRLERVIAIQQAADAAGTALSASIAQAPAAAHAQPEPHDVPEVGPWALTTAGVGSVALGSVLGVIAVELRETASAYVQQVDAADAWSDAQDAAIGASVAFVVGGAAIGAGLVWWIASAASGGGERSSQDGPSVEVTAGPGGLVVRGTF
jgi:tetratricopeptide (TPR) repeat protein